MENPSKKILETIKSEKIKLESRFHLRWKSYLFWIGLSFLAVLGALFFSLIILNFLDVRPFFFQHAALGKFIRILLITAPYLWILLLLSAFILSLFLLRKTNRGYRYSLFLASIIGLLFISFLGTTFHFIKFNRRVGPGLFRAMPPFSREMAFPIEKRWKDSEHGFLAGRVIEIRADAFMIISFDNEDWEVRYSPETKIMFSEPISVDMQLAVLGEKLGEKKFKADFIDLAPEFPFQRFERNFPNREGTQPRMPISKPHEFDYKK